ncbi:MULTISPECIES: helix-turn-helix domain-containing protein [unclassified Lactobacillus]|uniref:helix-turn-helix domain-containing protein n=1 Tax=unclassified Lactobacillus TaxID=2620435 RepID=UPI000EFC8ED8|nr:MULTISPECIES: helix-turn-helix transcriptional regulator [unclassified Lactobacillus]RMC23450.1 XRE family transcriptional regulator [Lactobacillus sp. ESL0247]RMC27040.1 XRE family transcriptional regulator [Lactobacillus sp. ESL0246]RMC30245.1 XRE family transcriptional regulator [Lactobacillus sp. ESL0245]
MTTSELLKQYRLRANKTPREWAGTAISPSFYSEVEKGLNRITADDLIKLLDYNGIPAANFFAELNPEKKLQYDREQELIKLMNDSYYQNSCSELTRLERIITQGNLPHRQDLLLMIKGYIALVTDAITELDTTTESLIKEKIFNIAKFDELFTWATETTEPLRMNRTIILVATPANMTFFETDNLSAQSGSAKIDTEQMSQKTKEQIFTNSWITSYKPVFISISEYIKGAQKDLTYTLYLFDGIDALLLVLSMTLVYAIIRIYQVSQQNFFNVKKFLGYSLSNIYRKTLLFLTFSFILELLTTILLRSRVGILVVSIKFILQLLFGLLYLRKSSVKQLLFSQKEDQ